MYRIAIVEDEQAEIKRLSSYLERFQEEQKAVFSVNSFQNGITFLSGYRSVYDLIFMDIEMPHMDGMAAAARLRELDEVVRLIFVTNMSQYAIRGYEVEASDFLVKPVKYEVFSYKLQKALARIDRRPKEELVLKKKQNVIRLCISEIQYVEIVSHQILYHTEKGSIEDWGTLAQIEKKLRPFHFSRCSACFLVNLAHVRRMDQEYVYVGEERLPFSRGKRQSFKQDMMKYLEENAQ